MDIPIWIHVRCTKMVTNHLAASPIPKGMTAVTSKEKWRKSFRKEQFVHVQYQPWVVKEEAHMLQDVYTKYKQFVIWRSSPLCTMWLFHPAACFQNSALPLPWGRCWLWQLRSLPWSQRASNHGTWRFWSIALHRGSARLLHKGFMLDDGCIWLTIVELTMIGNVVYWWLLSGSHGCANVFMQVLWCGNTSRPIKHQGLDFSDSKATWTSLDVHHQIVSGYPLSTKV